MKLLLVFISFLIFSSSSQASRLIEIEDYYSKKSSDFLKTRYPKKAFTVYVKVEAEGSGESRRPAGINERQVLNLPYLDSVAKEEVDFWTRKDLTLGTLISYLKSVYVKIDIDEQFSKDEEEQFKAQIFQHLKLSPVYDKVEVTERVWGETKDNKQRNLLLGAGAAALLIGFILLFAVFQSGIRTLVKGIAGPLSDIGKSTESFAKQPLGGAGRMPQNFKESSQWQGEQLGDTKVEAIKKQILDCEDVFSQPNGVLLRAIEDLGSKHPHAMGAIFRELPADTVKSLFRHGVGDWWYRAVTQPSSLNQDSAKIINTVSQLKMRLQLSEEVQSVDKSEIELGLLLSRLDYKMFGALFKGKKFEEAALVLKMVPRDLMIKVSKYLYPGQWAELLQEDNKNKLEAQQVTQLIKETLELCPLQNESIVNQYFIEADMTRYLDEAITKDEREVYRAITDDNRIKKERFPFYEVFQSSDSVLQTLSIEIPLDDWALVLSHCDQMEKEKIMKQMTERQYFMLGETLSHMKNNPAKIEDVIWAKKKIVDTCRYYVNTGSAETLGDALEASA